ncbi:MAG TPA: endonuclease/exonuclease/phosphatase family protein [Thermoanaerobaculia bacterium]|nr:endonuclease/exonuclease/phosphatase family protein [Thermoanaerobaculia bacterium]
MYIPSRLSWTLAIFLAGCSSARPPAERSIRVLVYNIHAGKDAQSKENLERVAELIRTSAADLVLLQEIDRRTTRSGGADHFAMLMRLTGMHGAFGKSLDYQGGDYGIATLSRWPVVAHEVVPLRVAPVQVRAGGSIEPRVALVVETRTPLGTLRVVNTHLDASREEVYRLQEVVGLFEMAKRLEPGPLLIGGDFNAEPGSGVHERMVRAGFRDGWIGCGEGGGLTYPAGAPVKRIDYLFLTGGFRCTSATVVTSMASDHLPLLMTLESDRAMRRPRD